MPIAVILLGALLLDLAFRGTEHQFAKQLGQDFGAGTQFLSWVAAIVILGALGYVPALSRLSNLALALVIVVLTLRNGGLFAQLGAVIQHPPAASASVSLASYGGGSSSSSGGGSSSPFGAVSSLFGGGGGSSSAGTAIQVAQIAATVAAA